MLVPAEVVPVLPAIALYWRALRHVYHGTELSVDIPVFLCYTFHCGFVLRKPHAAGRLCWRLSARIASLPGKEKGMIRFALSLFFARCGGG